MKQAPLVPLMMDQVPKACSSPFRLSSLMLAREHSGASLIFSWSQFAIQIPRRLGYAMVAAKGYKQRQRPLYQRVAVAT